MATKVQNYLGKKITWREGPDPLYPFVADFGGEKCVIRLNGFPDKHLYALIVNDVEIADFSDWPGQWMRPHKPNYTLEVAKAEGAEEREDSI